jgi:ATP-binding protein involved in chromosome partitioning
MHSSKQEMVSQVAFTSEILRPVHLRFKVEWSSACIIGPDFCLIFAIYSLECDPLSAHMPSHPGQGAPGPQPLPGVDAIIAVGSGKGGVGKTTLAVNLAVALAKMGHKVGLLDADVYGPNVPLMLGVNAQPKMVGENRIEPLEAFGLKVISVGFLNPGDKPIIWRGPMLHQIVKQFLGMVEWGHLDYMVVDLPPGTGDIALSLVQSVPLTGAVVVSTPSDVSLQDARKAIEMFRQMKVDLVGVVENMSFFTCPHCNHEIDIFSRGGAENMAKQFTVPFLGSIELDPEVRKSGDGGKPIVLEGENSPHAKTIFAFARKVAARVEEIKAGESATVIQIQ